KRCFRKGTNTNLRFSVWLPSNFLRAYFFPEEVLEIDTFVCDPFSTISIPYPKSNELDEYDADDLKGELKFEPEVTVELNVSVWKYMDVGLYLPMAKEDRVDEIGFVKRKIIRPAVARFLGRMTMTQATIIKLLRSKTAKFMMDDVPVTFEEYLGKELRKYGWDLRGVEVGDCNPPKVILEATEAVKEAEQLIEKAQNEARQIAETAKGEGFRLLNTLQPLSEALKKDPSLATVMGYYQTLQLYGGNNKFFAMLPNQGQELMSSLAVAIKAFGGTVPPAPPAPPTNTTI
ncbi:MAG: SPFH domain-containing protein, partial [bacterium]|nr:SPFH domain-containing protein [bacterium]